MKQLWATYGGRILVGFGVVALVGALVGVFWLLIELVKAGDGSLPLLAIGGLALGLLAASRRDASDQSSPDE